MLVSYAAILTMDCIQLLLFLTYNDRDSPQTFLLTSVSLQSQWDQFIKFIPKWLLMWYQRKALVICQKSFREFLPCTCPIGYYYSFKIFSQFWLAKSTCVIHHNKLLMTKFGRILCLTRKWRKKCSLLQVNEPLTEKTWGRGWVVLVVKKNGGHFTRFKSKNYSWN